MEKEEEELAEEIDYQKSNSIRIGNIEMGSNTTSLNEMANLIVGLLNTSEVKNYLDINKANEIIAPEYIDGGTK